MPLRHFALILGGALSAAALTVALMAALPGHGLAILMPLALIGALILRLLARR